MAVNDLAAPFPLIDADPHAKRVVKYFRGSDYALWAAGTAAAPAAVYAFGACGSFPRRPIERGWTERLYK